MAPEGCPEASAQTAHIPLCNKHLQLYQVSRQTCPIDGCHEQQHVDPTMEGRDELCVVHARAKYYCHFTQTVHIPNSSSLFASLQASTQHVSCGDRSAPGQLYCARHVPVAKARAQDQDTLSQRLADETKSLLNGATRGTQPRSRSMKPSAHALAAELAHLSKVLVTVLRIDERQRMQRHMDELERMLPAGFSAQAPVAVANDKPRAWSPLRMDFSPEHDPDCTCTREAACKVCLNARLDADGDAPPPTPECMPMEVDTHASGNGKTTVLHSAWTTAWDDEEAFDHMQRNGMDPFGSISNTTTTTTTTTTTVTKRLRIEPPVAMSDTGYQPPMSNTWTPMIEKPALLLADL